MPGSGASAGLLPHDSDLFRLLVASVRDYAIFLLDPEGRVLTWNLGAERIKQYRADEIVGRHFSVFYPADDIVNGKPVWELAEATKHGSVEDEGWRVRRDGTRFWASVVITALRGEDGSVRAFAKVTRDLTERRAAEEDLRRREVQLGQAQEALRLRDEFLSIASHELKTPLTGLQLRLQTMMRRLAKMTERDSMLSEQLEKAIGQAQRLADLIENLLDVSRIATGRLKVQVESSDLAEIVREAVELVQAPALAARSDLVVEAPPGIVGNWDRLRIGQVVTNLLDNAIKYGPGKPIDVVIEATELGARVSVRDRGIGVAPADRERIFERFERAVPAQNFGGLGLGLYVSKQIVEAHGGTLAVTSEPGTLTTFVMELPRLPPKRSSTGRRPATS